MSQALKPLSWHTGRRQVRELIPFPMNPRKMSAKQKKELQQSLELFDLVEIPAINLDNRLVAGHQRVGILMALGRGKELIDVRIPNRMLTEDEYKEYNIRSNRSAGQWAFETLRDFFNIDDLIRWGFELRDISFRQMITQPAAATKVMVPDQIVRYQIRFQSEEQQEYWYAFLKKLFKHYKSPTISGRIIEYVDQSRGAAKG